LIKVGQKCFKNDKIDHAALGHRNRQQEPADHQEGRDRFGFHQSTPRVGVQVGFSSVIVIDVVVTVVVVTVVVVTVVVVTVVVVTVVVVTVVVVTVVAAVVTVVAADVVSSEWI